MTMSCLMSHWITKPRQSRWVSSFVAGMMALFKHVFSHRGPGSLHSRWSWGEICFKSSVNSAWIQQERFRFPWMVRWWTWTCWNAWTVVWWITIMCVFFVWGAVDYMWSTMRLGEDAMQHRGTLSHSSHHPTLSSKTVQLEGKIS